jgi:hypothetical protein
MGYPHPQRAPEVTDCPAGCGPMDDPFDHLFTQHDEEELAQIIVLLLTPGGTP